MAPANLHWLGNVNNNLMSVAANYQEGTAPNAGDTIILDNPGGGKPIINAVADPGLVPYLAQIQINNGYTGTISIAENLTVNSLLLGSAPGATATVSVNSGSTLTLNEATLLGGALSGAGAASLVGGTFRVSAPSTESASHFSIANGAQFVIQADLTLNTTAITNDGTVAWVSGNVMPTATTITNNGMFGIGADGLMFAAGATLTSNGQILVGGAFGTPSSVTFDPALVLNANAQGLPSLEVQTGTLFLGGGVTCSGQVQLDAQGGLDIFTGTFTANAGTSFVGTGMLTVDVAGGLTNPNANNPLQLPTQLTVVIGSRLTGPGNFIETGNTTIRGTTLTNTTLLLTSLTTWTSGHIFLSDAQIQNQGNFVISSSARVREMAAQPNIDSFQNLVWGTLTKVAGDVNVFEVPVMSAGNVFLNGGALRFAANFWQTGGVVDLSGGTLDLTKLNAMPGTYQLNGGLLKGTGTISNVQLNNTGGIVEVSGILSVVGDYWQGVGGTFQVDASADNQANWGTLAVTGTATLSGNLILNLAPNYTPVGGVNARAYTILTAQGGVVGTFPPPDGWTESAANTNPVTLKKN